MNALHILRIAGRNVRRNARRSLLTIFAIAFGLLCLIVFQALKVGLHREMVNSTVGLDTGSLQIHAPGFQPNLASLLPLKHHDRILSALDEAGLPAAPRLKAQALLLSGGKSTTALLSGVEPRREAQITTIASRVVSGAYVDSGEGLLLGEALAQDLGISLGDDVTVMLQSAFGRTVTRRLPVTGMYRSALETFDRTHLFLPLPRLQSLLEAEDVVTEIAVRAPEGQAQATAASLRETFSGEDVQVRSWQALVPDVTQLIELNDTTMRLLILIVFAIVALGITNTMMMSVYERFREIGILTAIGTTPGGIVAMTVAESLWIGLAASLAGSLAGTAVCLWLARHGLDLTHLTSANMYFANSHILRAHLLPGDLLLANLTALATALLAGIYPAWKASRLHPAEAIRHV